MYFGKIFGTIKIIFTIIPRLYLEYISGKTIEEDKKITDFPLQGGNPCIFLYFNMCMSVSRWRAAALNPCSR